MMGTDKTILKMKKEDLLVSTKGRPKLNRDMARRLFLANYSTRQIAQSLRCDEKTVRRIKQELLKSGELSKESVSKDLPMVEADFDQECNRANGFSFLEWVKSRTKSYRPVFKFCNAVWDQVWERPSLVQLKDQNDQLGDQLCIKFLNAFSEDSKRIRDRKKKIRYLLRFLGRHDLGDRHLTVSLSRDPKPKRDMPLIELKDFPTRFKNFVENIQDEELKTLVMFKLVSQSRTGSKSESRGCEGLRKMTGESYIIMNGVNDFRIKLLEKMRESWDITHIPLEVRERLFKIYETKKEGESIFSNVRDKVKEFSRLTQKEFGLKMVLHDLRKISITWYYSLGVPLEIATMLNVGWKDLNTPRQHYLHLRNLMKKSERKAYSEQIPTWFKDGIEEYIEG